MHTLSTEIEIAASPERVRQVFLEVSKYSEWSKSFIKSIEPAKGGELDGAEPGDKLKVVLTGATFSTTVLDNTPELFKWRGSLPGIFTGDHRFGFQPSTTTPNGTTLKQAEDFSGLLSFFVLPDWAQGKKTLKGFEAFNKELKERAEQ